MIADWLAQQLAPGRDVVWTFGGPLAKLAPDTAWALLLGMAAAGVLAITLSYARALVRPARLARGVLAALRCVLWLALLVALAGPTLVERKLAEPPAPRPLAVLVDRSGSMVARDYRGQTRLDEALRRWRKLAPATAALGEPKCFAFSEQLVETGGAEQTPPELAAGNTRLFGALQEVITRAPAGGWGGIVTLTDGLETVESETAEPLRAAARAAVAAGTPLHFVVGRNAEQKARAFFVWREANAPEQVPPKSTFTLTLTAESFQFAPREWPVRLTVAGRTVEAPALFVNAGHRTALWQTEIRAETPGPLPILVEAGEGENRSRVRLEVEVGQPAHPTRVLYYEGAPDWSRRFLADILRRDPAFEFSSMSRILANGRAMIGSQGAPRVLPANAAGFANVDLLILANLSAAETTEAQQRAVAEWVGKGGALLFLAPDERGATDFAGSELERLFPVRFAPPPAPMVEDAATLVFRQQMWRLGSSNAAAETRFARDVLQERAQPELLRFAWEPRGRELFAEDGELASPIFHTYAPVAAVKPGAEVLARHPRETIPGSNERAVLLALQRYGRGQVAVLACDALWRWKLQEPSGARTVELFWQHLLAWLGRDAQPGSGLSFPRAPLSAEVGAEVLIEVTGREAPPAGLRVNSGEGRADTLAPERVEGNSAFFRWKPSRASLWALEAWTTDGARAQHWVDVRAATTGPTGEHSGLPPDLGTLELLAGQTGGAVLGEVAPAAWSEGRVAPQIVSERHVALWHRPAFFALLLGLFAAELLLRRVFRLL
ncbi:MAG TPA: hypothetical protein VK163_03350 [Opitutaceae bacterium]|nr:hypothetical protein [Opitutaceae bacterium]